jgi:acid phosphatase (class A)
VSRDRTHRLIKSRGARLLGGGIAVAALAWCWIDVDRTHFLPEEDAAFVASFHAPGAPNSPETRAELDELLKLQATRTDADVAAARADRKTEIRRFYVALGFDATQLPELPRLENLAEKVEDDVRIHVRHVKDHFRRLRPYEIEPRIEPCIDDVRGDLSYPSGHAAFAYSMYMLLAMMVPEREEQLESRAIQFARQRLVCGVHFPSDLAAGDLAARELLGNMIRVKEFQLEFAAATTELRTALRLPALQAEPERPD